MDALLPLWIIGSVLVLAIVDRLNIKGSSSVVGRDQAGMSLRTAYGT